MPDYHGVVYTKDWVVKLVLDIAGYTIDKKLWNKVIVEPSCGNGSFLREIIHRLLTTAQRDSMLDYDHLAKCVRCFDLDARAVTNSKSVVIYTMEEFGVPKDLSYRIADEWIHCADYLLSDDILADFVVGNPPYLRSTEIPPKAREEYVDRFSTMTKGCDIYVAFFQKGLESIQNNKGVLCYICADRWMQNQYGRNLRRLVSSYYHIDSLVRMHDVDAFDAEVSAYPAITRIDTGDGKIKYVDCSNTFDSGSVAELKKWLSSGLKDYNGQDFSATSLNHPRDDSVIPLADPLKVGNITKLMERFPTLEKSGVRIGIGIATGKDEVYIVDDPTVAEEDRMLPVFSMRDWRKHKNVVDKWLVNPWKRDGNLVDLEDYPRLKAYFENHRDDIASRHVAKKNADNWYRTIDKINWGIMGVPMLLFPDMAMNADPVYSDGSRYPCHNCYWLVSNNWDIKVLGGLLMSDIAESFIDALGVKMRGGTMRFQAQYLRLIHVPEPDSISSETASILREAFETNDRKAASKAARIAYKLEEYA